MTHEQRIAELHATYEDGRVSRNIYFVKVKSRFRVKIDGKWIGTFWTYEGAKEARDKILIERFELKQEQARKQFYLSLED